MELKLARCTIRDYRADDAESLARHANNRKVWLEGRLRKNVVKDGEILDSLLYAKTM